MNLSKYKAIFFDLDGTLIDSSRDLSVAVNAMATELSIVSPKRKQVANWIGNGTLKLVERVLENSTAKKPTQQELKYAFKLFSDAYRESIGEYSVLFPHTKELLVKLLSNKVKIACITNKPFEFTDFLLQQNFIRQFFSVVCAGDNVKHPKPDPWSLLYSASQFKLDIQSCLMIGDSRHDIQAARSAGCDVLAVTYGYNHGEDIRNYNPDYVIDDFIELL
jgi:phosphoglycolate phosphatase